MGKGGVHTARGHVVAGHSVDGPGRSYEIVDEIPGRPGIALARQRGELGFSKLVAIKSLRGDRAEMVKALVVDEARLRHANIIQTLDVVTDADGVVHVVMEYVDGPCLAEIIRMAVTTRQRLSTAVAAAIMNDVLLGIDHAHRAHADSVGFGQSIHCDVSPRTVMVGVDGLARVLDLGMPRTRSSDDCPAQGKLAYLAPEQLEGRGTDRTTDIYACGILFWELLTSKRLFDRVRSTSVDDVPKPSARAWGVPSKLDAIVMRALSRDPEDRFRTAAAMAAAIRDAVDLASRVEVGDAVRHLWSGAPHDAVQPVAAPAPLPIVERVRRARAHGRELRERIEKSMIVWSVAKASRRAARRTQAWLRAGDAAVYAVLRVLRRLIAPLPFASRVLLAFSAAAMIALLFIVPSSPPSPSKVRSVAATPTNAGSDAGPNAAPSEPAPKRLAARTTAPSRSPSPPPETIEIDETTPATGVTPVTVATPTTTTEFEIVDAPPPPRPASPPPAFRSPPPAPPPVAHHPAVAPARPGPPAPPASPASPSARAAADKKERDAVMNELMARLANGT